jgi:hypothetical protein
VGGRDRGGVIYAGSIKALLRRYEGSIKAATLRRNWGFVTEEP